MLLKNGLVYTKGKTSEIMTSDRLSALLDYPVKVEHSNGKLQILLSVHAGISTLLNGGENDG